MNTRFRRSADLLWVNPYFSVLSRAMILRSKGRFSKRKIGAIWRSVRHGSAKTSSANFGSYGCSSIFISTSAICGSGILRRTMSNPVAEFCPNIARSKMSGPRYDPPVTSGVSLTPSELPTRTAFLRGSSTYLLGDDPVSQSQIVGNHRIRMLHPDEQGISQHGHESGPGHPQWEHDRTIRTENR